MQVEYHEVPEMGHCGPLPDALAQRMREFIWTKLADRVV